MPGWQGKSKGTPLGYRIFFWVIKNLGVGSAYLLLRFVAFYFFLFSWRSSKVSFLFYRERLGFSALRSFIMLYQNYYVFGQTILDKIVVMAGIDNTFTYDFDGEENLHEIVKQGRGGILLSAHVGNWEAAGHLLKRLNTRINVVMFDGEHQRIKQYLEKVTGGHNFNIIVIREGMSHVYEIGQALHNNELICLHADRFLEGNKTRAIKFLNEQALFPLGPFSLAAGFRVPVSIVFAFKETSTHYHFYGSNLLQITPDEKKTAYAERLQNTFVEHLEKRVRQHPLQWFNYYDFWEKSNAEREKDS